MIRIFIGFDPKETIAYHVLTHSTLSLSSQPVSFTPISLQNIGDCYNREQHPLQSTDFSFSRFLTPYLSDYQGWSIFMDCDMLVLDDIEKLWVLRDDRYAVQVVKHQHIPKEKVKFLGNKQTKYQKKNWSSVMLFNNRLCQKLTPDYVSQASGLELHQFKWLEDDSLIGDLPPRWNFLVDYDEPGNNAALVHFTTGGPYFDEYRGCGYTREWDEELKQLNRVG